LPAVNYAENLPALKHIQSSGAAILDVGMTHGLQTVAAIVDGQFMFFEVSADGVALVGGLPVEMGISTFLKIPGARITELGSEHGLSGFYLENGDEIQVLYETPDHQAVIPGVMWDAKGENVTKGQIAKIAGALPQADGQGQGQGLEPASEAAFALVEKANTGLLGNAGAPTLYAFIDPLCIYSIRAMQQLQPFVNQGKLQVAIIPLHILDYEDSGRSKQAALSLLSVPRDQMAQAWTGQRFNGPTNPEAEVRLRDNMTIGAALRLKGTPAFFWRKRDGSVGFVDGVLSDWNPMLSSMIERAHAEAK
jgi:thiol:disulfide interchange protein DsbG